MTHIDNRVVLTEYSYTGLTGNVYHPYLINGKWRLILGYYSFEEIAVMCNIPEDDAVFLKLKYAG